MDFSSLVLRVKVMKLLSLGLRCRLGLSSFLNCRDHHRIQFRYSEIDWEVVFQSRLVPPAQVSSEFL